MAPQILAPNRNTWRLAEPSTLAFDAVDVAQADRVYRQYANKPAPPDADYKSLQDYLFRYIAGECGRLGMAVHVHTMAGAGGYFEVAGASPRNLEPLFDDPSPRKTKFVMVHGGWPVHPPDRRATHQAERISGYPGA